jgi:hypothetical protein
METILLVYTKMKKILVTLFSLVFLVQLSLGKIKLKFKKKLDGKQIQTQINWSTQDKELVTIIVFMQVKSNGM